MRTCKIIGAFVLYALTVAPAVAFADAASESNTLLPADTRTASAAVAAAGRSIANVSVNGEDSLVAMPSNDATPGTTMTFAETMPKADGSVKSFALSFSRDVTFSGYPSFRVSVPHLIIDEAQNHKFLLLFEDGDATVAFREDSYAFGSLQFIGGFFSRFHARANHTYHARVTIASASSAGDALRGSRTQCLQSEGHVTACLDLKNAKIDRSSELVLRDDAPQGVPPLSAPYLHAEPLYVSARATAFTSNEAILSLVVPLSNAFSPTRYNLAWRESMSQDAWHTSLAASVERDGDIIRLRFHFPNDNANRDGTIVLALYDEFTDATNAPPVKAPLVAVLGDSISILTVMPQNALGCIASNDAPNHCHYSSDDTLNYPGVVSQLTGARIANRSLMNASQTTVDHTVGQTVVKSWLNSSVLEIPPESDIVIVEAGIADIYQNHEDPTTSLRLPILAQAIVSRAPRAKIIFLGLRCCGAANETWNSEEKALSVQYGAFVDRYDGETKSVSLKTPDGIHCSPEYSRTVGASIVSAMKTLGF